MTQLNTPYPSTAYLTGFLRSRGVAAEQEDLALALVLRLLSRDGLRRLEARGRRASSRRAQPRRSPASSPSFDALPARRSAPVIAFLQGRDPTLAHRIARAQLPARGRALRIARRLRRRRRRRPAGLGLRRARPAGPRAPPRHALPERPRRRAARRGRSALRVRALRRDRWRRASRASTRWPTALARAAEPDRPRRCSELTLARARSSTGPTWCWSRCRSPARSTPPSASRRRSRRADPAIVTVLGGGFVNTELRELAEPRVFDHFDFVTLDAGERPLLALIEHLQGRRSRQRLVRTFVREADPRAGAATSTWASPTCRSPRSARRPGTGCRWIATCRCSTCSTRCTGCGATGAGTS